MCGVCCVRSGLFVPRGRFLFIFWHPQNCKREGVFDPSVFTLSSMFPFLEGENTNYPALWILYLLHFSTGPRDQFSCVVKFSIFHWKNFIFSHFLKKKLPKIDSQFTTLYRAPPAAKNAKNLLDHCSFSEKVISRAPRPSPTPALQGAEFQLNFNWISVESRFARGGRTGI